LNETLTTDAVSAAPASKYDYAIETLDDSMHYGRLAAKVGRDKRVLELGCNSGYLSAALASQFGCTVTGIELDESAANQARRSCARVITGDLDLMNIQEALAGETFDVILCADVLEHLRDPARVLSELKPFLAPAGYVVASIPHVGHGSVRLALLSGQFPYRPLGLLDDTHLRFFNRQAVEELFEQCGYAIESVDRNLWHIFDTEVGSRLGNYSPTLTAALDSDPEVETYQFIVTARPRAADSARGDYQRALVAGAPAADSPGHQFVEAVVFETPDQPVNDRLLAYLQKLNYSSSAIRFHFVRAAERRVDTAAKINVERFEFADHDFRRFRFVGSGLSDPLDHTTIDRGVQHPVNKGAILKWLLPRLSSEWVFVTDTGALPTADCLTKLVEFAGQHPDAVLVAGTQELVRDRTPATAEDGTTSWTPFKCVLLRRAALKDNLAIDADLDAPAQEVDFCWRLWLSGQPPLRAAGARFFGVGISDWDAALTKPTQLYGAARMRAVWGSPRQLASYMKHTVRSLMPADPWAAMVFLTVSLLSAPLWVSQRSTLKKSAARPAAIAFHGPGYSYFGPPPVSHAAPTV